MRTALRRSNRTVVPCGTRMLVPLLLLAVAGCAASTPPPPPLVDQHAPSGLPEIFFVEASTLNVRGGPGEEQALVGSLAQWTAVEVLARQAGGWVRIRSAHEALEGWVAERFLVAEHPWAPRPPRIGDVPISARVEFNDFQFTFHNLNDFDWSEAKIYVNPGSAQTYSYTADIIPAKGAKNLGAWRFKNDAGDKLDPARVDFDKISISCRTQKGRGYWSSR